MSRQAFPHRIVTIIEGRLLLIKESEHKKTNDRSRFPRYRHQRIYELT